MDLNDIYYAAGLVDGEGCIQIAKHKDSHCRRGSKFWLNINVSMCSPEAVYWMKDTFGGNVCIPSAKTTRGRTVYRWSITARQATVFITGLSPFLKVKTDESEVAIRFGNLCHLGSRKDDNYLNEQERLYEQLRALKQHIKEAPDVPRQS